MSVFFKASLSTCLAIDFFVMYLIHDVLIIPLSSSITLPPSLYPPSLPISLFPSLIIPMIDGIGILSFLTFYLLSFFSSSTSTSTIS